MLATYDTLVCQSHPAMSVSGAPIRKPSTKAWTCMQRGLASIGLVLLLSCLGTAPAEEVAADPYANKIRKASDEGLKAIKRFQVPAGLTVELFAAEPHVANIVAFCIDEH